MPLFPLSSARATSEASRTRSPRRGGKVRQAGQAAIEPQRGKDDNLNLYLHLARQLRPEYVISNKR